MSIDHLVIPSYAMNPSVLSSDGWMQWVEATWGLRPVRVSYSQPGKTLPRLDGVLYLDRKGAVRNFPLNPYMPFTFYPTNTLKRERLSAQWLAVSSLLAEDLAGRGLIGRISLTPGMLDGRSFQWLGFDVQIRYTPVDTLPFDPSSFDNSVRARTRKAVDAGYVAERSDDWVAIMQCLHHTETAKQFSTRIDAESLKLASGLIGDDSFRGYVVRDPKGSVVCGGVKLHTPNGVAIDWVQGSFRDQLQYGVNQLLYTYVLEDLTSAGAAVYDLCGANMPTVAAAKAHWGLPLVPSLAIGPRDLRFMVRTLQSSGLWMMRGSKRRRDRR